jgi:serine phosphatase RsbU (regulator of sigma subunit)/Tfp pilus assembly protein PilF
MNFRSILFLILFSCSLLNLQAQTRLVDSLISAVNLARVDSQKVKLYGDIAWELLSADISRSEEYAKKQLDLSMQMKNDTYLAQAESDMGNVLNRKGDFDEALIHYFKAVKLREKLKQPTKVAGVYNNIATIFTRQSKYKEAIDINFKALKVVEEANDLDKQTVILGNIGQIYYDLGQNDQASVYYRRSLTLAERSGNPNLQANTIVNMAQIKFALDEVDSALFYFYRAEAILLKNDLLYGLGAVYNNIGQILIKEKEFDKALGYFKKGLENRVQFEDEFGIALSYLSLGTLYNKLNNHSKAIYCLEKCEPVFEKNKAYSSLKDCYLQMATALEFKGELDPAIRYYKLWNGVKDSIYKKESSDQLLEVNAKYQTEKKEQENKLLNIQNALSEKTIKEQRAITYFIVTGLFLLTALAFFIFRGLRQQKKANLIISEQKREVEVKSHIIQEKHREITDSINYAERIQRSFLATKELLDSNLKDYFVFFLPKDIVSGDFYWASELSNGNFAMVTADSTGHGVPGAIMSILNISSLENAVKEETEPSAILDRTRKYIIERLKKDGSLEGGKDGMDASLIIFDKNRRKLYVAAANNPVWIVRGSEVIDLKPDKMPVGKHDKQEVSFAQHEYDLQEGDVVYTLTDGFPDQFGGPRGKKFMVRKLRELIVANARLPMDQQKDILKSTFMNWVGTLEQVDDVTIVGVRV